MSDYNTLWDPSNVEDKPDTELGDNSFLFLDHHYPDNLEFSDKKGLEPTQLFSDFVKELPLGDIPLQEQRFFQHKNPLIENQISTQENNGFEKQYFPEKNPESEEFSNQMNSQNSARTKTKRKRKVDNNLCKKCHRTSTQIFSKLNLKYYLKFISKTKYRREFFTILLIIAEKLNKLKDFGRSYKRAALNEIQSLETHKANQSEEKLRNTNSLIESYQKSIASYKKFADGLIEESISLLYDVNLKNKSYPDDAIERVIKLRRDLRLERQPIEAILQSFCPNKKKSK